MIGADDQMPGITLDQRPGFRDGQTLYHLRRILPGEGRFIDIGRVKSKRYTKFRQQRAAGKAKRRPKRVYSLQCYLLSAAGSNLPPHSKLSDVKKANMGKKQCKTPFFFDFPRVTKLICAPYAKGKITLDH